MIRSRPASPAGMATWGLLLVVLASLPGAPLPVANAETVDYAQYIHTDGWTLPIANSFSAVDVQGGLAYATDSFGGFHVFDVSDPAAMTAVGTGSLASAGRYIDVDGDHAYVCSSWSGYFLVVDVSSPAAPHQVSSIDLVDGCWGVVHRDGLVYIANEFTLRIFDVSTPGAPSEVSQLELSAVGVALRGDRAYIAGDAAALHVVDIADAAAPVLVTSVPLDESLDHVAVSGDRLYTIGGWVLQVFDLTDPDAPLPLGSVTLPACGGDCPYDMVVAADHVLVSGVDGCLRTVDVQDGAVPAVVGTAHAPGHGRGLGAENGHAFWATHLGVIHAVDLTHLADPPCVGRADLSEQNRGVLVDGDHAYAALGGYHFTGVSVIDVSNPAAPSGLSRCATPGTPQALAKRGDHLYVPNGDRLTVIDVGDPAAPVVSDQFTLSGIAYDAHVTGDMLHVTEQFVGARLYDIADPATPIHVETIQAQEADGWCTRMGDHLYLTGGHTFNVEVYDLESEGGPELVGTHHFPDVGGWIGSRDCTGSYPYLYVSTQDDGDEPYLLWILDCTDPTTPVQVGRLPLLGMVQELVVVGDVLYLSEVHTPGFACLTVVDVSDPASPTIIGRRYGPHRNWECGELDVDGEYVYFGGWTYPDGDLLVLPHQVGAPCAVDLPVATVGFAARAYPNPFNPHATLSFDVPRTQDLRVVVYDLAGRLVCELADGAFTAGQYRLTWDGRDRTGRAVPSGGYLARIAGAQQAETVKMSLVR